jgi:DNA-directed RNA polymerase omega subunit
VPDIPANIDSRFRYVLLIAKRAEQLIQGASPKIRSRFAKPTRIAMDEVHQDVINWRAAPPDESEPTEE